MFIFLADISNGTFLYLSTFFFLVFKGKKSSTFTLRKMENKLWTVLKKITITGVPVVAQQVKNKTVFIRMWIPYLASLGG